MMVSHQSNVFFFKFISKVPPAKVVAIMTAILVSYREIIMDKKNLGNTRKKRIPPRLRILLDFVKPHSEFSSFVCI